MQNEQLIYLSKGCKLQARLHFNLHVPAVIYRLAPTSCIYRLDPTGGKYRLNAQAQRTGWKYQMLHRYWILQARML